MGFSKKMNMILSVGIEMVVTEQTKLTLKFCICFTALAMVRKAGKGRDWIKDD